MNRVKNNLFWDVFEKIIAIIGIIGTLTGAYIGLGRIIGIKATINPDFMNERYFSNKTLISLDSYNETNVYRSDFIPQFHIEMPFKYVNDDIEKITVLFPDFEEGIKTANLNKPNQGNEDITITLSSDSMEKTVAFILKMEGKHDIKKYLKLKKKKRCGYLVDCQLNSVRDEGISF